MSAQMAGEQACDPDVVLGDPAADRLVGQEEADTVTDRPFQGRVSQLVEERDESRDVSWKVVRKTRVGQ